MRTEILRITPKMASQMILKNQANRSINHNTVEYYAMQMRSGSWQLNGEAIKFSKSGRLLDGQHRLKAIIKSGETIDSLVAYDVIDTAFITLDTGKSRNYSDVFKILDIKNGAGVGAGISLYLLLLSSVSTATGQAQRKISNQMILDEYNSKPDYYQNLHSKSSAFYGHCFRIVKKSEHFSFTAVYSMFHDPDKISLFWEKFLNKKDAAGLLYSRLMGDFMSKSKLPRFERLALFTKAINFHLLNTSPKILKFSKDESMPSILKNKSLDMI